MKKKLLAGLAALTCLSGALMISSPSAFASELPNDGIQVVNEETTKTNYYRTIPQQLIDRGEFDYGGLHYTVSESGTFTVSAVSNPASVKELILNYTGNKGLISYGTIDWTKYTNLENIIITGNSLTYTHEILAALPSGVNLYLGGACNIGDSIPSTIKNVYVYATHYNGFHDLDSEGFTTKITTTNVEKIYYNEFYQEHNNPSSFNSLNLTNKNGVSLKAELFTDWSYPEEVFHAISDFDSNGKVFEATGYYSVSTNSDITSTGSLNYSLDNISESVIDLDCTSLSYGSSIPYIDRTYGKIYMPQNKDYTFQNLTCDELIIRPVSGQTFSILNFANVKTLRFTKGISNFTINEDELYESAKLEKIYIPTSAKDKFSAITSREDLVPLVEYYDSTTYEKPTNSYLSEDGNIYNVKNGKYTIEEMEQAKLLLQTMGLEVPAGTVIDEMMAYYEVPMFDYSNYNPLYSARSFDTIVVPKNIDATKVVEAFQFIATLNHGEMSDATSTIIINTADYTPGYNGNLKLTIKFPDNYQVEKDILVKVMNTTNDNAYILDGNDVYIITNDTNGKSLASLMSPLMEYHLMETQVEYDESPLISADYGYLAGNSYQASLTSGKARVVVSNVELLNEDELPGDTSQEAPEIAENAEIIFKEINTIYTPESVDGSRFMSVMRDFLCTVDGEIYNDYGFAIGTTQGRTNKEDYTFTAWSKVGSLEYDRQIQVKIIDFEYDMGFVIFDDGDIAVIFNSNSNYTNEQIETAIKAFLTTNELNAYSFEMPSEKIDLTQTYEGTYDEGVVYIVNSGVNVKYSSADEPVDQTDLKQGFHVLTDVMYTKDFTPEEVLRALGKNILLKDGKLYTEDFTVEYTTIEKSNYVNVVFKNGEEEIYKTQIKLEQIESDYSYIFARSYKFDYGHLIMNKQTKAPEYDINNIMLDIIPRFRGLMKPFATEAVVDFTKEGLTDVDGIYQVGNGSYYEYEYNIEVANIKHLVRTNEVTVDGNGPVGETVSDRLNDFVDDFKTRFEENKVFKAATIALGTITGILILWAIYAIFRKLFKWLRR